MNAKVALLAQIAKEAATLNAPGFATPTWRLQYAKGLDDAERARLARIASEIARVAL